MTPSTIRSRSCSREIEALQSRTRVVLVDFHAEATSEKIAMGWHLDGRVTAVVGTHTHVQTADEHVLPGGTAYITDVGMTGPHDGDHRRRARGRALALPDRHALALRHGDRQPPAERRRDRRGRDHRPRPGIHPR